jgi:peptide/nickel transport system permease protein
MLRYTLKRLALLFPSLLVISLLAFGLNQCTPGDPIEAQLPPYGNNVTSYEQYLKDYSRLAQQEGLDLPVFYFSIHTAAYPDTMHRILPLANRNNVRRLIAHYDHWPATQAYYRKLLRASIRLNADQEELKSNALIESRRLVNRLRQQSEPKDLARTLAAIEEELAQDASLRAYAGSDIQELEQSFLAMRSAEGSWYNYLPVFRWNSPQNQYHNWWRDVIRGDLGTSRTSGQDVAEKISTAIGWTLRLNLSAIFIAYLLAIPLGVYAALYAGQGFDRKLNLILFFLYALPSLWVATMLSQFLTNPEYLNLFPVMGVGEVSADASWLEALGVRAHAFFLPVFCLTYGTLAFVTRQVRASMVTILESDFIRTARAKGLSERKVLWRHAFPNALFPLITMFGSLLPRAIAGAVIIEQIFSIPGVGYLTINSIYGKDWPIVYALLLLTAVLTITGILLADLLYAWADPRVQLHRQSSSNHV